MLVSVDKLRFPKRFNPNVQRHSSLKELKYVRMYPIMIDAKYKILDGAMSVFVARLLGILYVPCEVVIYGGESPMQHKRLRKKVR